MPNFIKYLTDIRAHFTIKNKIAKNKIISLLLLDQLFFLRASLGNSNIWGGGGESYFYRLNFENIKIIIYIYIYIYFFLKISKFWGGHGPPTLQHNSTAT